ncbi:MAG: type II secretion system F family protein [Pseudolabrys sp.]
MDRVLDLITDLFAGRPELLLGMLVFLAAGTLAFTVMVMVRAKGAVKRRATRILDDADRPGRAGGSLRGSSLKAVQQLLEYTTKHYASANGESMKVLRQRLIQAGIFDPRAVGYFFVIRTALAIGLAIGLFLLLPSINPNKSPFFWLMIVAGGIAGYVGPSMYLDKRISKRKQEYRAGFPDFMDLLVVCADSGLSMEAALDRVCREMGDTYPALTTNIHMTNLEIRAGRTLDDALERFAARIGLEEARSFTTLIVQSLELGSSITDALRVYSDDMRHKRLSRAEEKAYALPAKLSVPMMICIFPVLFVVILLPVVVKLKLGIY